MQLKCRINGVDYNTNLVQGATFSDEYNETLDSGTIIISNVNKISDLKPYTDVFIYTGEYTGYKTPVYEIKEEKTDIDSSVESKNSILKNKKTIRIHKSILDGKDATVVFEFKMPTGKTKKSIYGVKKVDSSTIQIIYKSGNTMFQSLNSANFTLSGNYYVFEREFWFSNYCYYLSNVYSYNFNKIEIKIDGVNVNKSRDFYKHLLVNQFNEEYVNLTGDTQKTNGIYKYKIELFSETKGLETVQLPNISVTQPLKMFSKDSNGNYIKIKKTVWEYLYSFVNMYSPKIRVIDNSEKKTWKYVNKYVIDYSLKEIFDNVYCPDFSLNCPNLRDVLSKLMVVKDYIPYVEDNVIKGLDITLRTQNFAVDKNSINFISATMSSSDYASNLRRNYNNALSQEYSVKMIEYLGFRNSSEPLMTLENMRLETRFPIYKINKIYLCYYKKGKIVDFKPNSDYGIINGNEVVNENQEKLGNVTSDCVFLCKQDITKLVKLNSERNLLSQDWSTIGSANTVEKLSKYKIATVGYDIGSNYIEGWGARYNYPKGFGLLTWFKKERTYIQNIAGFMDAAYPYGIYNNDYFMEKIGNGNYFLLPKNQSIINNIETVFDRGNILDTIVDFISGKNVDDYGQASASALRLKSFFFEVDYQGFYNGTVIHSKDEATDDITINDNSSSSLTLLEQDGLFQKEKINRYGNKIITIPARYKYKIENHVEINPISQLQPLGSVYNDGDEEDVVIFHREYSIYENEIKCTYVGSKDYVLKNYYTTVYAKHRTYNLMSYGESVRRSENKKTTLLLSKNKAYYDNDENRSLSFKSFNGDYVCLLFDAFEPENEPKSQSDFQKNNDINYAYIKFNEKKYLSDLNTFISGNSLCFNISMFDNVSMGVKITEYQPEYGYEVKNDYVGSLQEWLTTIDSNETGFTKKMGFYVTHINKKNYFNDKPNLNFDVYENYNKLFSMPEITDDVEESNIIYSEEEINKDNKEIIDMTFQIEPISENSDVIFSNWLMKLSSLITSNKNKIDENWEILSSNNNPDVSVDLNLFYLPLVREGKVRNKIPIFYFSLSQTQLNNLQVGATIQTDLIYFVSDIPWNVLNADYYKYLKIKPKTVKSKSASQIVIECDYEACYYGMAFKNEHFKGEDKTAKDLVFKIRYTDSNTGLIYFVAGDLQYLHDTKLWGSPDEQYSLNVYGSNIINLYYCEFLEVPSNLIGIIYYEQNTGNVVYSSVFENVTTQKNQLSFYNPGYISSYILTYYKNMFVVVDTEKMPKTIVYDEYSKDDFDNSTTKTLYNNLSVKDVFEVKVDKLASYIKVKLNQSWRNNNVKSVQYWYLDREDDTVNNEYSGSYKFVFGVNVTESDYNAGYVKIYISEISSKDKRVFDEYHNEIGRLYNFATNQWNFANKQNYYKDLSEYSYTMARKDIISELYINVGVYKITTYNYSNIDFNVKYCIDESVFSSEMELDSDNKIVYLYNPQGTPQSISLYKGNENIKTYQRRSWNSSDFVIDAHINSGFTFKNNSNYYSDFTVIAKDFNNKIIGASNIPEYLEFGQTSQFFNLESTEANYVKIIIKDFFGTIVKEENVCLDDVIIPIATITNVSTASGNVTYVLNIKNENSFAVNMTQKISGALSTETIAAGESTNVNITFYSNGYIDVYFQFDDFNGNYSKVWYGLLNMNRAFETISVSSILRLSGVSSDDIICYADFENSKILIYNNTSSDISVAKIQLTDGSGNYIRNKTSVSLSKDRIYNFNTHNDNISSYENIKLEFYLENVASLSFTKTCTPSDENIIRQYDKTRNIYLNVTGTYSGGNFNLTVQNTSSIYDANIGEIEIGIVNGGGVSDGSQTDIFIAKQGGTYTHSFAASPSSGAPIFSVKIYDYWGNLIKSQNFNA